LNINVEKTRFFLHYDLIPINIYISVKFNGLKVQLHFNSTAEYEIIPDIQPNREKHTRLRS